MPRRLNMPISDIMQGYAQSMTWTRHRPISRAVIALLIACMATGCSQVDLDALPPIPAVETDDLLPAVRAQLDEAFDAVRADPGDVDRNGRLAMILQTYKQFPDAEVMYRRARRLDPDDFRWAYLHGIVLDAIGRPEDSIAAFRRALEIDPEYTLASIHLAEGLADLGRSDEARAVYDDIMATAGDLSEAHFSYGRFLLDAGDTNAAIERFRHVLDLSGDFGAVHYQLGMAYRAEGMPEKSAHHLRLAEVHQGHSADGGDAVLNELLLLNQNDQPFVHRAKVLAETGRFREAHQFIMMALERNPDSVPAHVSLIGLATHMRDFDAVDKHFRRAIELKPDHAKAYFNLGMARIAQERYREALQAFQTSLRLDATDPNAHVQLAVIGRRLDMNEGAIENSLRDAIELDPDHQFGNWLLGELLIEKGESAEAIPLLERAISSDHRLRYLMFIALANARADVGEWASAFDAIERAGADAARLEDADARRQVRDAKNDLTNRRRTERSTNDASP